MRVTLVSTAPALGDKATNLAHMERSVQEAGGDLVVFPEMALTGYLVRDRVNQLAEPVDGPSLQRLSALAESTGKWILFGFPRADDRRAGVVFNSAGLVDPEGGLQVYDKRYLATFGPFDDGLHFTHGRRPGIFETPWGRLGITICYDLFFPELMKAQALAGATALVNISASPSTSRRFFEALFAARAIENALPVLYANFAGTQEDLVFWGGCQHWGPRGTLKDRGPSFEPHIVETEVDASEAVTARPLRPTVRDTREDCLVDLLDAYDEVGRIVPRPLDT